MTELKPCPFCGGKAKILKMTFGGVSYQVICGSCSANLDQRFAYEDEAIEAWNRRATAVWTPVSEDKPEPFQEVLVTLHENGWNGETYDTVKSQAYDGDYKITAWMPLPQPYKENEG